MIKRDLGRIIEADYSTLDKECKAEVFPLNRAFDMGKVFEWQGRYLAVHPDGHDVATERWNRFYNEVLSHIVQYTVPVTVLRKEAPKEAVCTVLRRSTRVAWFSTSSNF